MGKVHKTKDFTIIVASEKALRKMALLRGQLYRLRAIRWT